MHHPAAAFTSPCRRPCHRSHHYYSPQQHLGWTAGGFAAGYSGALDGAGEKDEGFIVRGGRMHEEHYVCYWDLLSNIPSYDDPDISAKDESFEFSSRFVSNAQARLLKNGKKLDVSSFGLDLSDQADLLKLTFVPESSLDNKGISRGQSKATLLPTGYLRCYAEKFSSDVAVEQ